EPLVLVRTRSCASLRYPALVRRTVLILSTGVLLIASLVALDHPSPAEAASITPIGAIELSIDRDTVTAGAGQRIDVTYNACVPDSAQPGDTIRLTAPNELSILSSVFPFNISLPTGGTAFVVTYDAATKTAIYTLTATGAAVSNLCFTSRFGATSGSTATGNYNLSFSVNGVPSTPTIPLSVVDPGPPGVDQPPTAPEKFAQFQDDAQCRQPVLCLNWVIKTPAGNHGTITLVDNAPSSWQFVCADLSYQTHFYNPTTFSGWAAISTTTPVRLVSCTTQRLELSIDTSGLTANSAFEITLGASASRPDPGGVVYTNIADWGGDVFDNSIQSAYSGGQAQGDAITIDKRDTNANGGDDPAAPVTLPTGAANLVFEVRNTGSNPLTNVVVSDAVDQGSARISGLSCDFSTASLTAAMIMSCSISTSSGSTTSGEISMDSSF
ncbi:MAG TPA: hypothetical protein PKV27_11690, partial [Ilumatobacteraceae bacterium]|nr:hypothetical protein [Ilumatobacteraceae bacterium]